LTYYYKVLYNPSRRFTVSGKNWTVALVTFMVTWIASGIVFDYHQTKNATAKQQEFETRVKAAVPQGDSVSLGFEVITIGGVTDNFVHLEVRDRATNKYCTGRVRLMADGEDEFLARGCYFIDVDVPRLYVRGRLK
jgi:hypothetical protein